MPPSVQAAKDGFVAEYYGAATFHGPRHAHKHNADDESVEKEACMPPVSQAVGKDKLIGVTARDMGPV